MSVSAPWEHGENTGKQLNKDLYRERADVLREWAGAEILYLTIFNDSSILANGVSVELIIPRHKGSSLHVPKNKYPEEPKAEYEPYDRLKIKGIHSLNNLPDLSVSSDTKNYYINWSVNRLQAQTNLEADGYVLIKTDKPLETQCTIFCDELPQPTKTTFKSNPPLGTAIVSVDELSDESYYTSLRDKLIMDGYVIRVFEEMLNEYELED